MDMMILRFLYDIYFEVSSRKPRERYEWEKYIWNLGAQMKVENMG